MPEQDKKTLSIAMFGQRAPDDPEGGGVEKVAMELSTRMAAAGQSVTCLNRSARGIAKVSEYRGVRERYVPTIPIRGIGALSSSFFAALLSALGPYDTVHIHAEGPAAMCWLPKLFKKRVIVTIHGLDWQRAKWKDGFGSAYIKFGEKMAARHADAIIVLSKSAGQYFKDTYAKETVYIPNGVTRPDKKEANLITKKWGLEKDNYILFLGRIVPEKGLRYLISAYKNLETDIKLVIAGAGSEDYVSELRELAAGDERIIFTGWAGGELLNELYSNAYVYCLPSDLEGMPLSLLEAMSYDNCCLVSDIPECADIVRDHGVTFAHGNVLALKAALSALIANPAEVERCRQGAADYILGKYSWDDAADRTLKVYRG